MLSSFGLSDSIGPLSLLAKFLFALVVNCETNGTSPTD